jgi:hypothetical protein
MSRIKIASIKTSSNQNRIIKTAQRAINISNACDIQGLYKHSSTFLDMAIKYASFITAQEEPKEEQRPNADEINWETLHQQNVHPELLEAYQEYNWNRQNYNQPREFLPQRKNVQYHFDESELQSAPVITKSFYQQLVNNNGNIVEALKNLDFSNLQIRKDNLADILEHAFGLSFAAYYKDNSYLVDGHPLVGHTVMTAARMINEAYSPGPNRNKELSAYLSEENVDQRKYNILKFLKEIFAEELASDPKNTLLLLSYIAQNEDNIVELKDGAYNLKISKEDIKTLFNSNVHNSEDPIFTKEKHDSNEIQARAKFIAKYGIENFNLYLQSGVSDDSFSDRSHIGNKIHDASNRTDLAPKIMNFIIRNLRRLRFNGTSYISFEDLDRIIKEYGENNVLSFFNHNEYDPSYIITIVYEYGLRKYSPEKVHQNLDLLKMSPRLLAEEMGKKIFFKKLDQYPVLKEQAIELVMSSNVPEGILENTDEKLINVCLLEYLDYVIQNQAYTLDSTIFYYGYIAIKNDIFKINPSDLQEIVKKDSFDKYRLQNFLNGIELSYKIPDEEYQKIAPILTQYSNSEPGGQPVEILYNVFDGNLEAINFSRRMQLPTPSKELNKKIGQDFLSLKAKGIYDLETLSKTYRFIPDEIRQKYDTHELGILCLVIKDRNDTSYKIIQNNLKLADTSDPIAIQRFENTVNLIKKKYPNLYSTKDEKYYTILKHLFMSPATKIEDTDRLFNILDVTRKSIQRKLVTNLNKSSKILPEIPSNILAMILAAKDQYCLTCKNKKQWINDKRNWYCENCQTYTPLNTSPSFVGNSFKDNSTLNKMTEFIDSKNKYKNQIVDLNQTFGSNYKITDPIKQILQDIKAKLENNTDSTFAHVVNNYTLNLENFMREINMFTFPVQQAYFSEDSDYTLISMYFINDNAESKFVSQNINPNSFGEVTPEQVVDGWAYNLSSHSSDAPQHNLPSVNELKGSMYGHTLNEAYKNLDKLILVFGNELWQWLDKFTTAKYFSPTRTKDDPENLTKFQQLSESEQFELIHDASQILPKNAVNAKNKGITRYLLQFYKPGLSMDIKFIITNWDKKVYLDNNNISSKYLVAEAAYMEPFKSNPKALVDLMSYQNMVHFFGDEPPKSVQFATEVSKWYAVSDDNIDEEEDKFEQDDDTKKAELTDEKYKRLEELYLLSQNVPLPEWANNNEIKVGKYIGRFLPRNDTRGMFLGEYTECCQHPENAAYGSAFDGCLSPKACFFVIEDATRKIHVQSYVWEDRDGNICFDSFEKGSRELFYSPSKKMQAQQIIMSIIKNMGDRLVTGGTRTTDIFPEATPNSNPLKNPGEGRKISYNAFGGVYKIYEGDSSTQTTISDTRNAEQRNKKEKIYPSVNGLKTIKEITKNNLIRPNMSLSSWEEDFTSDMNNPRNDEYDEYNEDDD